MTERQKRYTPGPWRVHTRAFAHVTSEYGVIANCGDWYDANRNDEQVPNAHLIAAAPELLEALEMMAEECVDDYWAPHVKVAREAITKAYGEES